MRHVILEEGTSLKFNGECCIQRQSSRWRSTKLISFLMRPDSFLPVLLLALSQLTDVIDSQMDISVKLQRTYYAFGIQLSSYKVV